MKIVCVSDIHCRQNQVTVEECDILISAGDYSFRGEPHVVRDFHKWMAKQPAKHKISVQGNHEKMVESNFPFSKQIAEEACPGVYFIDEGLVEIEGLKIWCSAITPYFCNWAWNRHDDEIQEHWDRIPAGIDGLVTHGPPFGILDSLTRFSNVIGEFELVNLGCPQLREKVLEIAPKFHAFGHIHPGYGQLEMHGIKFANAALCNDDYKLVNKPIIINL